MPGLSKIAIKDQIFQALVNVPDFDLTIEQLEQFLLQSSFQVSHSTKNSDSNRKTSAYRCFLSEATGTGQEKRDQWKIISSDKQSELFLLYQSKADAINASKNLPSKEDIKAQKSAKTLQDKINLQQQIDELKKQNLLLKSPDSDSKSTTIPELEPEQEQEQKQELEPESELELEQEEPQLEQEQEQEPDIEPESELELEQEQEPDIELDSDSEPDSDSEDDSNPPKPLYTGKKPETPLNNYKEWKKHTLGLPHSSSIKKSDMDSYKIQDNFDSKTYDDSLPWFQFIQLNMTV